jgi:hypothetical protein
VKKFLTGILTNFQFKGSLTQDFRLQVFFMNQCPPGPQVFHWSLFDFFENSLRYSRLMYITGVNDTGDSCLVVSTTPAKNLSPVSLRGRGGEGRGGEGISCVSAENL